ncbi:MAG: recombination protein RecR [Bacteroidales bacterium]|jgi:recombination protein RecR|nr:recombination protein RecR [Bacteroidales bacterium]
MDNYSSVLLERAVTILNKLPGIGRKTALRQALFLLSQDKEMVHDFASTLEEFRNNTLFCKVCHNISDTEICAICANPKRDTSMICVVSDIRDVMAIENTGTYFGAYHVLGGLISPMDGVSPSQLNIEQLVERVSYGRGLAGGGGDRRTDDGGEVVRDGNVDGGDGRTDSGEAVRDGVVDSGGEAARDGVVDSGGEATVKEVIFAFPATPEGDTTAFYITRKLKHLQILITTIAKGISIGDELEYTDEITLGRSLAGRVEVKM